MSNTAQRPSGRSFLIDAIKAAGCVLIVLHHMAWYGPMSDVVAVAWPTTVHGLYDYGRLAVQFFLVCAGFLTAGGLARYASLALSEALSLAWQRYLRLTTPLLAALSLTVLITEWVRPGFEHASLSAPPDWGQALAHIALLQHVLNLEALSAGIWYVAIDLQLYVMALLGLTVLKVFGHEPLQLSAQAWRWGIWLGLTCASLWWWNLHPDLDDHGVYFFGAYGLGLLAWEARRRMSLPQGPNQRWRVWALLLVLGGMAWWLEPRWRLAAAWLIACLLIAAPDRWFSGEALRFPWVQQRVRWLSKVSYSVFLIHFGVSLAVNAGVTARWPDALWGNVLGVVMAFLLSLLSGGLLHGWVERPTPSLRRWWFWVGVFMASVAMARFMSPVS